MLWSFSTQNIGFLALGPLSNMITVSTNIYVNYLSICVACFVGSNQVLAQGEASRLPADKHAALDMQTLSEVACEFMY